MIQRLDLSTENVPQLDELLQEAIEEVARNLEDKAYPRDKTREIVLKIVIMPDKADSSQLHMGLFKEVNLPKRFGKPLNGAFVNGRILTESHPINVNLFEENVTPIKKEQR
jgi:hypothetical protein